jgi:hypothetical protein
VLHAGVITAGVQREAEDAAGIVSVNVAGTVNVLEAARRHGVRRVVYPGSGAVYGANGFAAPLLCEEQVAPNPESLYAITKYAAERIALRFRSIAGLDVVTARLGGVFGPWEYATGQRDTLSPLLAATRLALADDEAVLEAAGRRDWIYAPDVAEALLILLEWPTPPPPCGVPCGHGPLLDRGGMVRGPAGTPAQLPLALRRAAGGGQRGGALGQRAGSALPCAAARGDGVVGPLRDGRLAHRLPGLVGAPSPLASDCPGWPPFDSFGARHDATCRQDSHRHRGRPGQDPHR